MLFPLVGKMIIAFYLKNMIYYAAETLFSAGGN